MVATMECMVRSRARESLAHDDQVGLRLGVEQVVLDGDDALTRAPQHPTAYDALRIRRRRLVEHRRRGGAPVDQQRVAVLVTQPDPADVPRHVAAGGRAVQVEAAEDQPLVRGVQRGDPLRGLEHHRVALHEPALVAQVGTAVSFARDRLRALGRPLELLVDAVHELLLGGDLLLGEGVVRRADPGRDRVNGQASAPGASQNHRAGRPGKCPTLPRRHRLATAIPPHGSGQR
jgi:hypothetical protein